MLPDSTFWRMDSELCSRESSFGFLNKRTKVKIGACFKTTFTLTFGINFTALMLIYNWTEFCGLCRSADFADRQTVPVGGLCRSPDFAGRRTLPVDGLCRSTDFAGRRTLPGWSAFFGHNLTGQRTFAGRQTLPVDGLCQSTDFAGRRTLPWRSAFFGHNFTGQRTFAGRRTLPVGGLCRGGRPFLVRLCLIDDLP